MVSSWGPGLSCDQGPLVSTGVAALPEQHFTVEGLFRAVPFHTAGTII